VHSPIGVLEIAGTHRGVRSVRFVRAAVKTNPVSLPGPLTGCVRELKEYFEGCRQAFLLPLEPQCGTAFEQKVWKHLKTIPFGETASYSTIAKASGCRRAARSAGSAARKNRLPILIPCHRMIAKTGKVSGFTAGAWRKAWLLNHERKVLKRADAG